MMGHNRCSEKHNVHFGLTQLIVSYRTGAVAPLALPLGELAAP